VEIYLFSKDEGGRNSPVGVGYIPHTFCGPRDSPMEIAYIEGQDLLEPGTTAKCTVAFLKNMPLLKGESKLILRESNSTIGVGVISATYVELPPHVDLKGRKSSLMDTIKNKKGSGPQKPAAGKAKK
jgi:translation elongation factor EF-Tu-like GTPase